MPTTETRLTVDQALYACERLLSWADSEAKGQPSTVPFRHPLTGTLAVRPLWAFARC